MEGAGPSIARSGVGVLKVWIRAEHNILDGDAETRDWKTQDWKTWDQIAGVEKAGLENAGTSCVWVAKCNIVNVRGHVRVNVTAGRGDPRTLQEATQSGN